jgi:hypothetical protein
MSINVEGWKTLISCGLTATPLASIARSGDIESVENALKAGMAVVGRPDSLIAAAELVDADAFCGSLPRRAEDVLIKWAAFYSADDLSYALISLTDTTKYRPHGCAVLVRAGADPYREVAAGLGRKKQTLSALENALTFNNVKVVDNLVGLLGCAPITDPTQLPRLLNYTNTSLYFTNACNALEFAIADHNMHAAAWLVNRIDRDSPARELLFDLGDIVLRLLSMDESGKLLSPTILRTSTNLATAYEFIVGGAEFRSPDLWEKVFNRKIAVNNDQPYLSSAVVTRNSGMTGDNFYTCLGIFIDNGCLKIDSTDHTGHTMLMSAARNDSHEVVDLLLQRGASVSPTATINTRKTPVDALYYAKKSKNSVTINKILAATAHQAIARTVEAARSAKIKLMTGSAP